MSYALIAGGSKGIGLAIAQALARRKYDLILIGRHTADLHAAKEKLELKYKINVETLAEDLQEEATAKKIAGWCKSKGIAPRMLCNVAGMGGSRDFLTLPSEQVRTMTRVNIESMVTLTDALIPLLAEQTPSYILNVGSMAGFAPIPVKNVYAATKSAVIFFSYALRYQLKDKNISVSCLCPGPVFTKPDIRRETLDKLGWLGEKMAVDPEAVGEIAVRHTLRKRLIIVPGILATILSISLRVLPRRMLAFIYYRLGKKD